MTAKTTFTFDGESSIWTSSRAISIGARSAVKPLIAIRLSGATRLEMVADAQKSTKPISIPVKRYQNLGLKKLHKSQRTNENINTADIEKLYIVLVRLVG